MADGFLTVVDAVELWVVSLPLILQIPLLLAILLPVAWGASWVIDRVVELGLRRHTARSERTLDAELAGGTNPSTGTLPQTERTV